MIQAYALRTEYGFVSLWETVISHVQDLQWCLHERSRIATMVQFPYDLEIALCLQYFAARWQLFEARRFAYALSVPLYKIGEEVPMEWTSLPSGGLHAITRHDLAICLAAQRRWFHRRSWERHWRFIFEQVCLMHTEGSAESAHEHNLQRKQQLLDDLRVF